LLAWFIGLPLFSSYELWGNGKTRPFYGQSLQRCRSVGFSWSFHFTEQGHAPCSNKKCTCLCPPAITVSAIIWWA
jgi:hypothetical protein